MDYSVLDTMLSSVQLIFAWAKVNLNMGFILSQLFKWHQLRQVVPELELCLHFQIKYVMQPGIKKQGLVGTVAHWRAQIQPKESQVQIY